MSVDQFRAIDDEDEDEVDDEDVGGVAVPEFAVGPLPTPPPPASPYT